jgi:hypothetical protein
MDRDADIVGNFGQAADVFQIDARNVAKLGRSSEQLTPTKSVVSPHHRGQSSQIIATHGATVNTTYQISASKRVFLPGVAVRTNINTGNRLRR